MGSGRKSQSSHEEQRAVRGGPKLDGATVEARLARVEQAVETFSIGMERVSEVQRFVTKLLIDRAPPAPGQLPPG